MILLIDNYDSFTYNLYHMIVRFYDNVTVVMNDKITLSDIKDLNPAAIVISPGPGHPNEAGICVDLIRHYSGIFPILGVCLGHQAIVQAFGGEVIRASRLVHGSASPLQHTQCGLFSGVSSPFIAGRYHSLIAEPQGLPTCLRMDAYTEQGEIMAVSHLSHHTYGVQFHPESLLTPEGDRIVESFLNLSGVVPC